VGAAAEAVQAEPAARRQFGALQRPVADDARAQQRRELGIRIAPGDRGLINYFSDMPGSRSAATISDVPGHDS
jgi:hypothetical protein